ncbi:YibE/F-like protein [Streptohalobacillus salinus]|uniref:YibE/F-like protein n=1 Tax=Streptohalobacillus salinus TaxID=621096 RepID=A0A2V3VZ50_9BACI|nr:YibE/F family protein [Streptohalobacillus salinus]PXW87323.1 YibE/F-like protein [Streptohalobacillus salinus]
MDTLVVLLIILFVLMVLIGRKKGFISFVTLFINFAIVMVTVFIMMDDAVSPIFVTLIACVCISRITLFFINGDNKKTRVAFYATLMTTALLLVIIQVVVDWTGVGGFSTEEVEELAIYNFHFGVDFTQVVSAVILMSTIGAMTDEAISIASPMYEFYLHRPTLTLKELVELGMGVGKDLLVTSANTLFFAFFGGYLALFVRFYDMDYSLSEVINAKVFAGEVVTIILSGTGIILIIPMTAYLTAFVLTRKEKDTEKSD